MGCFGVYFGGEVNWERGMGTGGGGQMEGGSV